MGPEPDTRRSRSAMPSELRPAMASAWRATARGSASAPFLRGTDSGSTRTMHRLMTTYSLAPPWSWGMFAALPM
mgnify:CR=1 FL=1